MFAASFNDAVYCYSHCSVVWDIPTQRKVNSIDGNIQVWLLSQIKSPMFQVEEGMVQRPYGKHVRLLSAISTYDTHVYVSLAHYFYRIRFPL